MDDMLRKYLQEKYGMVPAQPSVEDFDESLKASKPALFGQLPDPMNQVPEMTRGQQIIEEKSKLKYPTEESVDAAIPPVEDLNAETDRLLSAKEAELAMPPQPEFQDEGPFQSVEDFRKEQEGGPDVAAEQAQESSESLDQNVDPAEFQQPNKGLDALDPAKKEDDQSKLLTDPLAYIKDKYKMDPDVSYDELKKMQRKSGIMESLSELDTAVGGLGDWKLLEAKKGGYEGSYKGGALGRVAGRDRKDFDEKYKYQQDELKRKDSAVAFGDKSMDLIKGQHELRNQLEDDAALRDPNSLISQVYRQAAERLKLKVPPTATAKSLEKVLGFLKERIGSSGRLSKLAMKDGQIKEAIPSPDGGYIDQSTGEPIDPDDIESVYEAPVVYKDAEGNPIVVSRSKGTTTQIGESRKPLDQMSDEELRSQPLSPKMQTQLEKAKAEFLKQTKDNRSLVVRVGQIQKVSIPLAKENPLKRQQIQTEAAKILLQEVGNLAQHDKDGISESGSLVDSVQQYIEGIISGKISDSNLSHLSQIVDQTKLYQENALRRIYEGHRKSLGGFNISPYHVDRTLGPLAGIKIKPYSPAKTSAAPAATGKPATAPSTPQEATDPDAERASKEWNMPYDQAKKIIDARKMKRGQ